MNKNHLRMPWRGAGLVLLALPVILGCSTDIVRDSHVSPRRVAVPIPGKVDRRRDGIVGPDYQFQYRDDGRPDLLYCTVACEFTRHRDERLTDCENVQTDEEIRQRLGSADPGAVICVFE